MSPDSWTESKFNFDNRVALVTGAAGGLGIAICLTLANCGANIVAGDVCRRMATVPYESGTEKRLSDLVNQIKALGRKAIGIKTDVTKSEDVRMMVCKAIDEFGRIDVLVNNAGIFNAVRLVDMSEQVWDEMMAVHLRGAFLCCKHVIPHMIRRKWGRIINMSSIGGLTGVCGLTSHYVSAKHGLIGLTRALALELGEHGITVNAVCPGETKTPMVEEGIAKHYAQLLSDGSKIAGASSVFPDCPRLQPQDIADSIAWLASDAASHVTGIALPVDAGFTAH